MFALNVALSKASICIPHTLISLSSIAYSSNQTLLEQFSKHKKDECLATFQGDYEIPTW